MKEIRLIRFKQLRAEYIDRGRTTIWQMVKDKRFPAPVRIGKIGIAWRSDEIRHGLNHEKR